MELVNKSKTIFDGHLALGNAQMFAACECHVTLVTTCDIVRVPKIPKYVLPSIRTNFDNPHNYCNIDPNGLSLVCCCIIWKSLDAFKKAYSSSSFACRATLDPLSAPHARSPHPATRSHGSTFELSLVLRIEFQKRQWWQWPIAIPGTHPQRIHQHPSPEMR